MWPVVAGAQQGNRVRRIGVLMSSDESDPEQKRRLTAFTQALVDLGWTDGRNVRMDVRWAGGDTNRLRALARELVGLQPPTLAFTQHFDETDFDDDARGSPGKRLLANELGVRGALSVPCRAFNIQKGKMGKCSRRRICNTEVGRARRQICKVAEMLVREVEP